MAKTQDGKSNEVAQHLRDACWKAAVCLAKEVSCCDVDHCPVVYTPWEPMLNEVDMHRNYETQQLHASDSAQPSGDKSGISCSQSQDAMRSSSLWSEVSEGNGRLQSAMVLDHRLCSIRAELGPSEHVSELLAASLNDLQGGGHGVVLNEDAAANYFLQQHMSPEKFHTTARFYASLGKCANDLAHLSQQCRESVLKQRLKVCNELIRSSEHCKVCLL